MKRVHTLVLVALCFSAAAQADCRARYIKAVQEEQAEIENLQGSTGGDIALILLSGIGAPFTAIAAHHDNVENAKKIPAHETKKSDLSKSRDLFNEVATWGKGSILAGLVGEFVQADTKYYEGAIAGHRMGELTDLLGKQLVEFNIHEPNCAGEKGLLSFSDLKARTRSMSLQLAIQLK